MSSTICIRTHSPKDDKINKITNYQTKAPESSPSCTTTDKMQQQHWTWIKAACLALDTNMYRCTVACMPKREISGTQRGKRDTACSYPRTGDVPVGYKWILSSRNMHDRDRIMRICEGPYVWYYEWIFRVSAMLHEPASLPSSLFPRSRCALTANKQQIRTKNQTSVSSVVLLTSLGLHMCMHVSKLMQVCMHRRILASVHISSPAIHLPHRWCYTSKSEDLAQPLRTAIFRHWVADSLVAHTYSYMGPGRRERCSKKGRRIGRALKECRARLYIIRWCVVRLFSCHDWASYKLIDHQT